MNDVQTQIYKNNLTFIETIFAGNRRVGNSLFILNSLIYICEIIKCKKIISPEGLKPIIKNPIFYKEYNITIFPYSYISKIKIDLKLRGQKINRFIYSNKPKKMKLLIIKKEILNNVPKYNGNLNDLIIKMRSGDIFRNHIHPKYSQPPLCFYQKILNKNKFNNIYILSNGHENPVVDELLKIYPKIKYKEGSLIEAISIIIYSYNFVMPVSTFPQALIIFNSNLRNLYIFERFSKIFQINNYNVHIMRASDKYIRIMKKWNKTKEQLNLMINDKCIDRELVTLSPHK